MKRLICLMAALLLLTGCAAEKTAETTDISTETATQAEPTGLYSPNHPLEQSTAGAVRVYPLGDNGYTGMVTMGNKLVLLSEKRILTVLEGENCEPLTAMVSGCRLSEDDIAISTSDVGISCYLDASREILILNPMLQVVTKIPLPEDIQGRPAVSMESSEVYYCQGNRIFALDIASGIARMVKEHSCVKQELTGVFFDGALLACRLTDGEEEEKTVYIDTRTGRNISADSGLYHLNTSGDTYYALRRDGVVEQKIFGKRGLAPESFNVNMPAEGMPSLNGAVTAAISQEGLKLDYYDLKTGRRISEIFLPLEEMPLSVIADQEYLWILGHQNNGQVLYRWDMNMSPAQDDAIYTGVVYTAENPDQEGLAACRKRAEELGKKYGVRIHIGEDALRYTGAYAAEAEYQILPIQDTLEQLDKVMSLFPYRFLKSSIEGGRVHISLVRHISEDRIPCVQFYTGGNAHILLSVDGETRPSFLQGIGYVIDSHVLGNSRDYDTWAQLNPPEFSYDLDYGTAISRQDQQYLQGQERAFVDNFSKSFPHEDRCRIFTCAMDEAGQEVFDAPIMQSKLLRMCQGIREAYGLEKKSEVYPWEQFLTESIAYSG